MFKPLVLKTSTIPRWSCWVKGGFLLILAIFAASLHGQATSGSISGLVLDQNNAVVIDATIQIANLDTQIATTAKSGSTGLCIFPSLPPGNYETLG